LPRSNVCSTRDLENPSASVHLKRFSTPSLTLKFLCAGKLNPRFGICALATSAHLNPWPLLGAAIVGAIFGDGLSFWLGRRYHREILLRWPLNRYPQFIDRSEAFIKSSDILVEH
jgi:hypothetical protein